MDKQDIVVVSIHKPCPGCGEPLTIGLSLCPACLGKAGPVKKLPQPKE
jgi:NMD protein affecting ribosome stability and mRNA decay